MKTLIIALALCVAGCASPPAWTYATDIPGNVLPSACRQDLSLIPEVSRVPVLRLARADLDLTRTSEQVSKRQTLNGRTLVIGGQPLAIQIASDLSGFKYDDTILHEECHVYCQLTKNSSCTGHFTPIPTTAKNG